MLPNNVLRPTADHWGPAWGDRPVPPELAGESLELHERFEMAGLGGCLRSLAPGQRAGPLHYHHIEEEVFYVLDGELVARELRPGDEHYTEVVLRAGDVAVYPPGTRIAHCSINRSGAPVRYLALSNGWATGEVCIYPDSGKTLVRALGQLGVFGGEGDPAAGIAAARAVADARPVVTPTERPAWILGPATLPENDMGNGAFGRPLSRAAGATQVFLNVDRLAPGAVTSPLHWHTAEEEMALVLAGTPTLRQLRDGHEERATLQPDDIVHWPANGQLAHQIRNESDADVVIAVVGTSRPDDVLVFPEHGRIHVRALGRSGILRAAAYFDGE